MSDLAKILDSELQAAAHAGSAERFGVMVALDVPVPRVRLRAPDTIGSGRFTYAGIAAIDKPSEADEQLIEQRAQELRDVIRSVGGGEPNYLRGSHAFVTTLTGAQLRELAHSPLVREIRFNRHLR